MGRVHGAHPKLSLTAHPRVALPQRDMGSRLPWEVALGHTIGEGVHGQGRVCFSAGHVSVQVTPMGQGSHSACQLSLAELLGSVPSSCGPSPCGQSHSREWALPWAQSTSASVSGSVEWLNVVGAAFSDQQRARLHGRPRAGPGGWVRSTRGPHGRLVEAELGRGYEASGG